MVMDQKVFESQRFLGQLKYDLVKAQEKLAEREAHLADLRSMIRHGFGDLKMKVKYHLSHNGSPTSVSTSGLRLSCFKPGFL